MTRTTITGRSSGTAGASQSAPYTVIWDGDCGFCGRCMNLLQRMDPEGRFVYLTCQSPERERRFPAITRAQCLEALQLVAPGGTVRGGADAVQSICSMLPWTANPLRWVYMLPTKLYPWMYRLPGAPRVAALLYKWVARHRVLLGTWTYPFLKHIPRGPSPK